MSKHEIIGLIRMRNESLILKDTLDHFSKFVDGIIIFDDNSVDNSVEIAKRHDSVLEIIENKEWSKNRELVETLHRQILLDTAQKYKPKWLFYSDCDERFEGNIREFLISSESNGVNGIKISLFDAYITHQDNKPYRSGELYNFRKYFGPEVRNILMVWRNNPEVKFQGLDAREPKVKGKIITKFFCQHYGKSLSIEHWEETCDYYSKYFAKYRKKWLQRKGKAIHKKSDFGHKLYTWEKVKKHSISINEPSLFFKFWKKIKQILFK